MAKITKHYTLPNVLIDEFKELPIARSAAMALSVSDARREPRKVLKALERRISLQRVKEKESDKEGLSQNAVDDTTKVTVTLDEKVVDALAYLSRVTHLPVEHVLRLSMEAYVHKL